LDPATLDSLTGLEVRARHIVEGYLSGLHRSPLHGRSVEFAQYRPYAPGDELRHVDWKLWARSDRYYVKLYEEETNVRAHFLMDASGSMTYASRSPGKYSYGATLAASLAYLLLLQQDAVGLSVFGAEVRDRLPPAASPAALRAFCSVLEATTPGGETGLGSILPALAEEMPRRGMVVLISDLLAPTADILSAMRRLRYDGHSVVILHVIDPAEEQFPFDANVRFEGIEGEAAVQAEARQVAAAYRQAFAAAARELAAACRNHQIDYVRALTDEPFDVPLARLLLSAAGGH
jgi:uncharacterized protein (DUF58 family)